MMAVCEIYPNLLAYIVGNQYIYMESHIAYRKSDNCIINFWGGYAPMGV